MGIDRSFRGGATVSVLFESKHATSCAPLSQTTHLEFVSGVSISPAFLPLQGSHTLSSPSRSKTRQQSSATMLDFSYTTLKAVKPSFASNCESQNFSALYHKPLAEHGSLILLLRFLYSACLSISQKHATLALHAGNAEYRVALKLAREQFQIFLIAASLVNCLPRMACALALRAVDRDFLRASCLVNCCTLLVG